MVSVGAYFISHYDILFVGSTNGQPLELFSQCSTSKYSSRIPLDSAAYASSSNDGKEMSVANPFAKRIG